jgi:uncharacterized protein (DUF58 family)
MPLAELLGKVRRIEIRSRHLVEDLFAGRTASVFKGRGIEFDEVRPYVPGDEVRDIDWNVTARMGEPFIKRFVEERELSVILAVDVSRSMRFGTVAAEKRELAAELCAVLGFAALRNNDRVGLVLTAERVETYVPPARGKNHLLRILRDVLGAEPPPGGTRLGEAARFIVSTSHRRSLVFWISDFEDRVDPRALRLLGRRHEVTAFLLRDPRDEALPNAGWVELEDLESGRRALLDTGSAAVREAYARASRSHRQSVERALAQARVPLVEVRTDRSYLTVLMRYFTNRRRPGGRP